MGKRYFLIAALILSPAVSLSQELRGAEMIRATKEFNSTLAVFNESQLVTKPNQNYKIFRIIIAPTFYHPLAIRIEQNGNEYSLVAKRLSGQGGYNWGKLEKTKKRNLSEKEWLKLLQLIREASFWTETTEEKEPEPNENGSVTICLDSTSWTLEGIDDGKYHMVYRYCPERNGVKSVGLYMVQLTGWRINEFNFR
jgi:hypothetical protein